MSGTLFVVVGPSGVGKDTVMNAALAQCPHVMRMRRVITRRADAGGETIDSVTAAQFETLQSSGAFALTWGAHGLRYGVPIGVKSLLANGQSVVFNGSRKALLDIHAVFPEMRVLSITADPDILRARLIARGRETGSEVDARLKRALTPIPASLTVQEIANSGMLRDAVSQMVDAFNQATQTA